MRSYTRHQLKQDAFATSTADTIHWAVEHRSKITTAAIVVVVILAVLGAGWAYINYRDQQASADLAKALEKYDMPIRPAGTPPSPEMPSYASSLERAQATNPDFNNVANKYSLTQSAQVARYFAGLTARDLGDNATAEKDLKEVAGSRHHEIASLARVALAAIYHDTNRNLDAVDLYKQLIDHPTVSVGKSSAQLMLASLYETMARPDEARHIYEQMQKENPTGPAAEMASQKLVALSKK